MVSKGDERKWKCFESKIRDKIAKVFFIIEFESSERCLFLFLLSFFLSFNIYFILSRYFYIYIYIYRGMVVRFLIREEISRAQI